MFDGIKTNEDGLNIKFHQKTQDVELLQHFVFCFGWERILSTTLQAKSALSGIINEDPYLDLFLLLNLSLNIDTVH